MGPGVFYSWNELQRLLDLTVEVASMGPGVFYSWNTRLMRSVALLRYSFNGARSFLLLEFLNVDLTITVENVLQWGQEFFTPGIP